MLKIKTNAMKWARYLRRSSAASRRQSVNFVRNTLRQNVETEIERYVAESHSPAFKRYMNHESGGWGWFSWGSAGVLGVTIHTRNPNLVHGTPERKGWLWVICGSRRGHNPPNFICSDITKETGRYASNHMHRDMIFLFHRYLPKRGLPIT